MSRKLSLATLLCLACFFGFSQQKPNFIAEKLRQKAANKQFVPAQLFESFSPGNADQEKIRGRVSKADFFQARAAEMRLAADNKPDLLNWEIPVSGAAPMKLQLFKADVYTDEARLLLASNPGSPYAYDIPVNYWGVVGNDPNSLASISISTRSVEGFIYANNKVYNLGRLGNSGNVHIIYEEAAMTELFNANCTADMLYNEMGTSTSTTGTETMVAAATAGNCVNMYFEVDNDIVVGKGSVQNAADYMNGVFSQVAMLYANEQINWRVNEVKYWDVTDPYTGTSTSNFLSQFRSNVGSSFNGNLAHLVGYKGGGGVAYVNVLCNKAYGHGYSGINSGYNLVPNYSWTIEVVTHEIGHNLGSPHTHNCSWNGNNTPIDGCGPAAGYSESNCSGVPNGPVPAKGTIMSYCHLVSGVGIDFNLGFGPQPGDLIRSRVYNASCLSACPGGPTYDAGISAISAPTGTICNTSFSPGVSLTNYSSVTLTSATIQYKIDNGSNLTYNWTGSLAVGATTPVTLPQMSSTVGNHNFTATAINPNGQTDGNSANNSSTSSFTIAQATTFYRDADGDGRGNPGITIQACTPPAGYVTDNTDCNDNNASIYPGAPCNDGNVCTTNDVYNAQCNCSGSFADSDGDGVCDANDQCPGGDDRIDLNNNGIPDACECAPATTNFGNSSLNHTGSGSTSTSVSFKTGDKNPGFTINGLNARTGGKPDTRFTDIVTITYVDGKGVSRTYGSFSGANQSTVSVAISGEVRSITVALSNGDANNNSVAVNLSPVDYCGSSTCPDSDGDGVCDADDICPGGDDRIDSDGDGIPDFCDTNNCQPSIFNFSNTTLNHTGAGQTITTANFGATVTNASFTITNMNGQTGGKPAGRFDEQVQIMYVDAAGTNKVYGTFNGSAQNSVSVNIAEAVQSITIILRDGYSGNSGSQQLSVSLSAITACATPGINTTKATNPATESTGVETGKSKLYPNPASDILTIDLGGFTERAMLTIYSVDGRILRTINASMQRYVTVPVKTLGISNQLCIVQVLKNNGTAEIHKVMIQ